MTPAKVLYTAKAHTTGGRDGASRSSDGRFGHQAVRPQNRWAARDQPGTNPEQLFAAGWSACFMGAMGAAAA
jgi:organic hydroperoxide reductase OsmC/OhrA